MSVTARGLGQRWKRERESSSALYFTFKMSLSSTFTSKMLLSGTSPSKLQVFSPSNCHFQVISPSKFQVFSRSKCYFQIFHLQNITFRYFTFKISSISLSQSHFQVFHLQNVKYFHLQNATFRYFPFKILLASFQVKFSKSDFQMNHTDPSRPVFTPVSCLADGKPLRVLQPGEVPFSPVPPLLFPKG